MGEELDKQYSPSMWSNRLPAELVMDHHIKSLAEGRNMTYGDQLMIITV